MFPGLILTMFLLIGCTQKFGSSKLADSGSSASINGVCGSAGGVAVSSAPSMNLCSKGTPSAVTGADPFDWTCNGINDGTNASCSAPRSTLSPPAGYMASQLIFEDKFTSAALDVAKWNPWMGEDTYGRWGNQGNLPAPYSGQNSGSFQIQYLDPYPYGHSTNTTGEHLVGGNGLLSLIASPSDHFASQDYTWASACISSYGKAYIPATGGYAQFRAKMPDTRYGAWPGIWFMPNAGSDGEEFDLHEGGYFASGAPDSNYVLASHWWGGAANQIVQNTGVDLSADYHVYGVEYLPGQSWKVYLDGNLMATWTSGISTNAKYELIIEMEMAGSLASGWHTVADPVSHPGPFKFEISDVQIYQH